MAAESDNTYISETVRDTIKIPTANLEFTTIKSSKEVSRHMPTQCRHVINRSNHVNTIQNKFACEP